MKRVLLWLLTAVVAAGAVWLVPVLWFKPWTPDLFYARVFASYMLRHPMILTSLGMLENTPFRWYADDLDDMSIADARREAKFVDDNLKMLRRYDRAKMTPPQRLSADVMEWFLADQHEGNRFMFSDYPVNQLFGMQKMFSNFMTQTQPLKSGRDARAYVGRVAKIGRAMDQITEQVEYRERHGVMPPHFVMRHVVADLRTFVDTPVRQNPIYAHFAAKADSLKGFEPKERDRALAELERSLDQSVIPAYRRLLAACERIDGATTDDDGIWKLPDGDAYYDYLLRHHTTTDMPADTIHALGEREVERIQSQMKALLRSKGMASEPFGRAVWTLRHDDRFGFPAGDVGRAQILAGYQAILDDAAKRCDTLFDVRPKARLEVKRVPEFSERGSAVAYYDGPAMDGSRPGVFYANLADPTSTRRPDMRTLAYHEGVPGHHFQITIAQELKDVAFFRKVIPFTAYAEGWGLYAERLALEQGFHQDAYDSLGAYQAELFRAARLVVDTGIHRKHWTRQQAIDWMVANTGMDTSSVVAEVERYIVSPGQACAYKVGQLAIVEMREHAKQRLGDRFDLRKFHDVVLTNGALPLTLLRRVVDEWVERELRAAGMSAKG